MGSRLPGRGVNDSKPLPPPFQRQKESQALAFPRLNLYVTPRPLLFSPHPRPMQTGSLRTMVGVLALWRPASETPSSVWHSPLCKSQGKCRPPSSPLARLGPWPPLPSDAQQRLHRSSPQAGFLLCLPELM